MRRGAEGTARGLAVACLALIASGCATLAPTPALVEPGPAPFSAPAALAEVNAFRRSHGLKPLVLDQRLLRAAVIQADYQAGRGAIGHRGAGGSKAGDRVERLGYRPILAAENVASGQKSFSAALRGWQGSAPHRRNLLLPDAEAAGVAVSYRGGRAYYTLVLGAER
jgi:uncharacterized protein YkwD